MLIPCVVPIVGVVVKLFMIINSRRHMKKSVLSPNVAFVVWLSDNEQSRNISEIGSFVLTVIRCFVLKINGVILKNSVIMKL